MCIRDSYSYGTLSLHGYGRDQYYADHPDESDHGYYNYSHEFHQDGQYARSGKEQHGYDDRAYDEPSKGTYTRGHGPDAFHSPAVRQSSYAPSKRDPYYYEDERQESLRMARGEWSA